MDVTTYELGSELPHEFELVDLAELYRRHASTVHTTHRAAFYHVIWLTDGGPATHLVDFNPVQIEPNSLLFLNKNIVHRFENHTNSEGKRFYLPMAFSVRPAATPLSCGIAFCSMIYSLFSQSNWTRLWPLFRIYFSSWTSN